MEYMLKKLCIIFLFLFSSNVAYAAVGEQWVAGALDVGSFPVEENSKNYKKILDIDVDWSKIPKIRNFKELNTNGFILNNKTYYVI